MRPIIRYSIDAWTVDIRGGNDDIDEEGLPPDLTRSECLDACMNTWNGWLCTRAVNHTQRHAAGNGRFIVAVWPDHLGRLPKPVEIGWPKRPACGPGSP